VTVLPRMTEQRRNGAEATLDLLPVKVDSETAGDPASTRRAGSNAEHRAVTKTTAPTRPRGAVRRMLPRPMLPPRPRPHDGVLATANRTVRALVVVVVVSRPLDGETGLRAAPVPRKGVEATKTTWNVHTRRASLASATVRVTRSGRVGHSKRAPRRDAGPQVRVAETNPAVPLNRSARGLN
jgi:hypothetical protein